MKPTNKKPLPCAVFGHNYMRSKTNSDQTVELTCTHCNTIVVTDSFGNFENNTLKNPEIADTLRELYQLTRQLSKTRVAS
ncbi:hypothetical protein [Winogradskyella arenosi]|uniref:Prophage protein DUF1660 n=1 Tax=Winogradskyella arenosi TaxID=533325 RepID=A0A368ZJ09_9FLAO|nr:hypothetical protein [Winogradskyella arenosi]RCW93724.1 hypothetical protein DFQ08_101522 [Winogradskyella arenosi]